MQITINILEVCNILAHQALLQQVSVDEKDLWTTDEGSNKVYKDFYQDVFSKHYDYYFEILSNGDKNNCEKTSFSITKLTKDDLDGLGYDTTEVTEEQMERLALKLGKDYCEQLYWIALPIMADYLKIPKIKHTIHFGTSGSFVVDTKTYDYFNSIKGDSYSKAYNDLFNRLTQEKLNNGNIKH